MENIFVVSFPLLTKDNVSTTLMKNHVKFGLMLAALLVSSCGQQSSSASSSNATSDEVSSIVSSINTLVSDLSSEDEQTSDTMGYVTSDESSSESVSSASEVISSEDNSSQEIVVSSSAEELSSEQLSSQEEIVSSEEYSSQEQISSQEEISSEEPIDSTSEELTSDDIYSSEESYVSSDESTDDPMELYWSGLNTNDYGDAFRVRLKSLIKATGNKTIGYSENNGVLAESDKALNGKPGIIPFYHADNCYTTGWNKEHVWPNSRGAGKSGPGSDPQMLRPTASSCNSARGNKFYGLGPNEFDPYVCAGDTKTGDEFPAYAASRGEAARIIFYVAARYGTDTDMTLSNNPADDKTKHTMGTLSYLYEWNNTYPVTAQERRRNEYLHSQGFARNPFIDNRDLVNYIWDADGYRTSKYEGGTLPDVPPAESSEWSSWSPQETSQEYSSHEFISSYTFNYAMGNWPGQYPQSNRIIEDDMGNPFTFYYAATFDSGNTLQFKKSPQGYLYNNNPLDPIDELVVTMDGNLKLTVYAGNESNPSTVVEPDDYGAYHLYGAQFFKLVNETGTTANMKSFDLHFAEQF